MIRKLIKHGESSLTVSLPRSFVKEMHLKKGDEIEVREADNGLFISSKPKKELRTVSIDVSGQAGTLRKILGASYKCGYDEVNIMFSSFEELKEVKDALHSQFAGYEILAQGKNNIQIRKLSEDDFSNFDTVLRRFFLVIKTMTSDTAAAMGKSDFEWLKSVALMKYESDRLADYCRRAINTKFKSSYKRLPPLYTLIEGTEKVSDHLNELCNHLAKNKIKPSKDLQDALGSFYALFDFFYCTFFKFDLGKSNDFRKLNDELKTKIYTSLKKAPPSMEYSWVIIDRMRDHVYSLNGPLMACFI